MTSLRTLLVGVVVALADLYPTHDDYVRAFRTSTKEAVAAGFVLGFHGRNLTAAAAALPIGA